MDAMDRLAGYAALVGRIEILSGYAHRSVGDSSDITSVHLNRSDVGSTDPTEALAAIYAALDEFNERGEAYVQGYCDGLSALARTRGTHNLRTPDSEKGAHLEATPGRPRLRLIRGEAS